jgi:hypothetical protein
MPLDPRTSSDPSPDEEPSMPGSPSAEPEPPHGLGEPSRPRRRVDWIQWFLISLALLCVYILSLTIARSAPPTTTGSGPGCMSYGKLLEIPPGAVASYDVEVRAERCAEEAFDEALESIRNDHMSEVAALEAALADGSINQAEFDRGLQQLGREEDVAALSLKKDVTIGSKVKVELTAPLFDGTIAAIADEVQTFDETHTIGRWSWQIRPNTPGNYTLSLELIIYDKDGNAAMSEQKILTVHVYVPVTTEYVRTSAWTGFVNFLASLQGVVASVGAIAAGTAGFRAWMARRSKKAANGANATSSAERTDSGYM